MSDLVVYRIADSALVRIGHIARPVGPATFRYEESYLQRHDAHPLSLSLPLERHTYQEHELRPYFEGLLPEGRTREALVAQLGVREDDYLTLLGANALDCIGDVVVREESEGDAWDAGRYVSLDRSELQAALSDFSSQARSNTAARLSLAGTQGKVGLAHRPGELTEQGWLLPREGAASTHILKVSNLSRIAEFELVCMRAARACDVRTARTDAFVLGDPVVCSERYDRRVAVDDGRLRVTRLHQEDLAQAFGVSPHAKYLELEGGSYHAIAQILYERSSSVLEDLEQLARLAIFDYLVGNCDNHLKNLSVVYEGETLRLAPAYDIVCTTFFERFSREMGKRLGSTRAIDEVSADDFAWLARDLGMGVRRMRRLCAEMCGAVGEAIGEAAESLCDVLPTLPYTAEDLLDDMRPRLQVVQRAAAVS